MPSRLLQQASSPPPPPLHHTGHNLVPPLAGSVAGGFSLLLLLLGLCFRRVSQKRTVPSSETESKQPRRLSYSSLRRATSSFSPALRLGQGGFGSVYRGTLKPNLQVAVKVMDSGSLQGEREFHNELFFAGKIDSKYIASVIGFSSSRRRRRMLLVYELLANGSLQDCLLHRKCAELMDWKNRFSIALDIAKGLEYLHHFCDPPIIHGDVKPSNILLDNDFKPKISDFGLARLKTEEVLLEIEVKKEGNLGNRGKAEDNGSVIEETESVATAGEFEGFDGGMDQSPESCFVRVEASPETVVNGFELSPEGAAVVSPRTVAAMASPSEAFDRTSVSDGNFDRASETGASEMGILGNKRSDKKKKKSLSGKDWWWKQDNAESESGPVKDYVKEWIGNEIKKERPKGNWIGNGSSSGAAGKMEKEKEKKKNRRRFDWWVSLEDDKNVKKESRRPAREWWREEYTEELARKKKKMKKLEKGYISDGGCENWWPKDDELYFDQRKRSRSKRSSRSSMDRWLDGLSGDLWRARKNSHDSVSGEIARSGGISSTPSMRGTVCYAAPEYGIGGDLSEKCDVYSYGVLLLVLVAGRRPLQVTGSPMSEFQRANLLSWARHLARAGKLIDLVDQSVHSLDKEQALLCITVALVCLQKSPARRPSMQQVVEILLGQLDAPQLPIELSPSPPSRNPYKSRKKGR